MIHFSLLAIYPIDYPIKPPINHGDSDHFHLLQFLYYSERDTRQSCELVNASAEVLGDTRTVKLSCLPVVASYVIFVRRCKSNNKFLNSKIIRTKNDYKNPRRFDSGRKTILGCLKLNKILYLCSRSR